MSEIDPSIPLLPTDQPYIVIADHRITYSLRTPPGAEAVYIFRSDGESTDEYYSGIRLKAQGVFETEQEILFDSHGDDDEYAVVMDYGIPYLRPIWHFRLIGREIFHFSPPQDTNWGL